MLFDHEKEQLQILSSHRTVFSNIHYRIKNDENIKKIFKNLKYYIDNYDEMEWGEKFYFNNNFDDVYELLRMFVNYAINDGFFKDKSAEEIIEPCSVLSDSNGISFMKIVGYFSILSIFNKKRLFEQYKSKIFNDSDLKHVNQYQEERVQSSRRIFSIRDPEKDLKNYDLMNIFYSNKVNDYKNNELSENEALLMSISKLLTEDTENNVNNVSNNILKIGKQYWDSRLEQKREQINQFAEIFKALADNIEDKEKES